VASLTFTKAISLFLLPPGILILLIFIGVFIANRRVERYWICSGLILLYALSTEPVSDVLLNPLESRFLPLETTDLPRRHTAIVLLGGGIDVSAPEYGGKDALSQTALARTTYAAYLARRTRLPVYTAGGNPLHPQSEPEGEIMYRWLVRLGVPADRIRTETASNTTCENASLLMPALRRDRIRNIVLVTSAVHMPRAVYCFAKLDVRVIPAPCAYLGKRSPYNLLSYLPQAQTFSDSSRALREYLGMLWYRFYY